MRLRATQCYHNMRTKRELQNASNANRESTRGVRCLKPRLGLPHPFGVQWAERVWDDTNGREIRKVKSMFFATAEARDTRAAALRKARREGMLRTLTRREIDEWAAFKTAIGAVSWQDVVAGWQAYRTEKGLVLSTCTVDTHVKDYLARLKARKVAGGVSAGTYQHRNQKLSLFAEHFGHLAINQVLPDDVRAWLRQLQLPAAGTFNNYRKILSAFFSDAVDARLLTENPIARVAIRDDPRDEVGILTVPQIAHLFHTALTALDAEGELRFGPALWRLSLEAFAGVRYSSACRLKAADVNATDRGIRHPARSIKTKKRQYVDGYPDVLWAFLAAGKPADDLSERHYLALKSALFAAAGVPHPHNCLRHSFATYHVASRANPGATAYLLCHRDQKKLWDHYKGNATSAEGAAFEALRPESVLRVALAWTKARAVPAAPLPSAAGLPSQHPLPSPPAPADGSGRADPRP